MVKSKSIAIIDDDEVDQMAVQRYAGLAGVEKDVLVFSEVEEALEFFRSDPAEEELPDILFLDINLPKMDGWDFLEAYKKIYPSLSKKIDIYMLSSSINQRDIERAENNGFIKAYIQKPIKKETVLNLVEGR